MKEFVRAACARPGWSALLISSSLALAGCGDSDTPPGAPAPGTGTAPVAVAYAVTPALYVAGEAIGANAPVVTGGPASAFSVTPALPAGLALDPASGVITGTPAAASAQATYTVTAGNAAGSVTTPVQVEITSRGSWTATSAINPARHYHAATRLLDGRVLVTGGLSGAGATNHTALYDPATGVWGAAAPMGSARYEHTAVLLADGRVLVAGGLQAAAGPSLVTSEIYDPATDTWAPAGALNVGRSRHASLRLPDNRVLAIGGLVSTGPLTVAATVERFDPATATWTQLPTALSVPRTQHAAELLPGGNTVLVVGGINSGGFVTSSELYPASGVGPTTAIAGGGTGNVAVSARLSDDTVLVVNDGSTTSWRFHPSTLSWTTSTQLATRSLPALMALPDGRAVLAGGSNLASAEIYNPGANVWTSATGMATVRRASATALLADGSVLAIGGFNAGGEVGGVEIFRP